MHVDKFAMHTALMRNNTKGEANDVVFDDIVPCDPPY
jgi:hypothetical protein